MAKKPISANAQAAKDMRKWLDAVDAYNKAIFGQTAPFMVSEINADKDGYLTVTFKLKPKSPIKR